MKPSERLNARSSNPQPNSVYTCIGKRIKLRDGATERRRLQLKRNRVVLCNAWLAINMKTTHKVIAALAVVALLAIALPHGCTRPDDATRVLAAAGYKDIEITGWRPFAKSEKDVFSTGFRAKSPGGEIVTGAVTSGWLKGSTIRLD